jgi:hypothetical protein
MIHGISFFLRQPFLLTQEKRILLNSIASLAAIQLSSLDNEFVVLFLERQNDCHALADDSAYRPALLVWPVEPELALDQHHALLLGHGSFRSPHNGIVPVD